MARPTVEELATHARVKPADVEEFRDDLQRFIGAACGLVESSCGPLDDGSTRRVRLSGGMLLLPFSGVESVTVTGPAGAAVVDVTASDLASGIVRLTGATAGTYTVTVVREKDAEDALWLAALIIAKNLWDLRRGATATRPGDDDLVPERYAVPSQAWGLMAPWADLGVA